MNLSNTNDDTREVDAATPEINDALFDCVADGPQATTVMEMVDVLLADSRLLDKLLSRS